MKKLSAILSLGLLVACSQNPEDLESLQSSLKEKLSELKTLTATIDSLEAKIAKLDTTSATAEKLVPVEALSIQERPFEHFVRLSATITSKENVLLSAESSGRVVAITAKEGDRVQKGDVIMRLESDFIEGQLQEAEAAFKLAKTTFERRARLWKDSIGAEIEYLSAETNYKASENRLKQVRAQYDKTFVKAPVSGTLDAVAVNEGEFVAPGAPVARVVDLANLELETELSESYLAAIKVGDPVEVNLPALGLSQKEKVIFTSQYINPANRSFTIKVSLNHKNALIKPNLLAEISLKDYAKEAAIVVPSLAVQKDLKGDYVYIAVSEDEATRVKKSYLELGKSFGEETEVVGGLNVGDQVIIAGYNEVSDGQSVDLK